MPSPVLIKMASLRSIVHASTDNVFDLKRYKRVPKWLVEYKSMALLVQIVMLYQFLVHLLGIGILLLLLSTDQQARELVFQDVESLLWFSCFTTVSAYTNCGFALLRMSMIGFADKPLILGIVGFLVMAGNTMLPIFLRWAIVFASSRAAESSSKKVYLRYLLLNGRTLSTNLFNTQQTWTLLVSQISLTGIQVLLLLAFSSFHNENMSIPSSIFLAINTRHAGFATMPMLAIDAASLHGAHVLSP